MLNENDLFDHLRKNLNSGLSASEREADALEKHGRWCTPVVIDSVGFTRISQKYSAVYFLERFVQVADLVGAVFKAEGGTRFRAQADNLFVEFETPLQALAAVVKANLQLEQAEILIDEEERYRFCVGIGYGLLLRSNTQGVYGNEMNLAAKLGEDIACGDELLLTPAALAQLDPEIQAKFENHTSCVSKVDILYHRSTWQQMLCVVNDAQVLSGPHKTGLDKAKGKTVTS